MDTSYEDWRAREQQEIDRLNAEADKLDQDFKRNLILVGGWIFGCIVSTVVIVKSNQNCKK